MTHPELPANIEAEKAALGSVLLNREALVPIAAWLRPAHFYLERHGEIYAAMLACLRTRKGPNIVNVATELRKVDKLDGAGGMAYLSDLVDAVAYSSDIEHHAREVERCAVLRTLIRAGGKIAALGYDQSRTAEQSRADALKLLSDVQVGGADDIFQPLSLIIDSYYTRMGRVLNGETSALGVATGYRDLDDITGGLHDDELTILAARPAVGKTSMALSMAYNIARRGERDVLIASLEMSKDQLLIRLLSMETKIDTHRLRMHHLNDHELDRVMNALGYLNSLPIFLADISAMTADQIRLAALRHLTKRERPIVPMVDYLQLMGSTKARENRVQDVSDISRGLKNLARELHTPVVALSQLSRAVEGRASHVPMLSDLRESGSLEQDADNVWFLYREELYQKDTDKKGITELHIAKHRQGPIGVIPLRFDAATTRFDDLTYRQEESY